MSPGGPGRPALYADTAVFEALPTLAAHRGSALPVHDGPGGGPVGQLAEHDVLDYLRRTRGR